MIGSDGREGVDEHRNELKNGLKDRMAQGQRNSYRACLRIP